jgi:DNA-binding NarL/FixJ family response regulator
MAGRKGRHEKTAIPVGIVEEHPLAAQRLREILQASGRVRTFSLNRAGARDTGPSERASIVIVDRDTLPEPLGERLRSLRLEFPRAKTLLLARTISSEDLCHALLSGVKGFVPYEQVEDRLGMAIRAVWGGHLWVDTEVLEELAERASTLSQTEGQGRVVFTPAEERILGFLPLRLSNKEIASEIGVSERTVKFHLGNVFTKVGVRDRYSLIDMLRSGKLSGLGDAQGRR